MKTITFDRERTMSSKFVEIFKVLPLGEDNVLTLVVAENIESFLWEEGKSTSTIMMSECLIAVSLLKSVIVTSSPSYFISTSSNLCDHQLRYVKNPRSESGTSGVPTFPSISDSSNENDTRNFPRSIRGGRSTVAFALMEGEDEDAGEIISFL